ncbi:MAG: Blue-light-activated protein [Syntrophaceae bacterium PtaB.Bin038]|nr:MAG: Blue-light-activated protein [Syntrophaceae bacterium PtaB.Bin038]
MKKKKILVVDNHPIILEYMSKFLSKDGHEVRTSEDGLHALDLLESWRPDIIFVDLIMPNIDGKKLCQIIRAMPEMQDTYLIILSAAAAEEQIDFRAIGANACIAKGPLDKMGQYVVAALHDAEHGRTRDAQERIFGVENLYSRQITKELLTIWKHFEVVLGSLSEGILEITAGGRIVYANPTAIALTGIPEERLLASSVLGLFDAKDKLLVRDMIDRVAAEASMTAADSPVKLNDREFLIKLLPIRDDMKRTLIMVLEDVSEHRRIEAQFHHAQRMEAVGTLAGGIAHDFNNLLMVIQGNISLMLYELDPKHPFHDRLRSIEKQVQSGSRLTAQLLGYARKGRYEVRPIDLNQLVEEACETFSRTRKEILIHQELARDLYAIEADAGQLEQVLMNLFVNAADAMPGGGSLIVRTANTDHHAMKGKLYNPKPGNYVQITVSDSGTGMDKKTMERIFEPFFTTKEMGRGTGLGLASVYGIVKGHGGFIDVDSQKGKGTTFRIYLAATDKPVVRNGAEAPEPITRGSETILLVDDEQMMLDIGRDLLQAMGYRVITARDGEEAVEVYRGRSGEIDLVLLDIVMPKMGGGQAYDCIKAINPAVKVLLLSGYSIDGEATQILARGCNGFIQKPFNLEQLSRSVKSVLTGNGTQKKGNGGTGLARGIRA